MAIESSDIFNVLLRSAQNQMSISCKAYDDIDKAANGMTIIE
jgi:hypothetical protein